jgi:hypothetical protein
MKVPSGQTDFEMPQLDGAQQGVVDCLRRDGIAAVPFGDLFDVALWDELEADLAPFVRETESAVRDRGDRPAEKKKNDYLVQRFYSKRQKELHRFSLGDPWLRLYASTAMLDIVNSYRGEWTKLSMIDNWFTVPYPRADERIASQQWHRDPEEEHVVKVFLYFSDVDDEAGPFEYIAGSPPGGRHGDLWPWGEAARYPPEDELLAATPPVDRLTLTGPAGTMIVADTSGFHRGGFARTKPRILSISRYMSVSAKAHAERRFEVDFDVRRADLSAQACFALE